MILFKCPHCQGALKTSNPNLVGKKIKCPKCGAAVPVPADADKEKGKVVPAIAPGPRPPAAAGPKGGATPKPSAPKRPPPSDWEDEEAPALPKPKAKKPAAEDDWSEEESPAPKKPAAKPRKKGGFDLVAILVLLLLAGYVTAVVLFMLDIVYF